MRRAALALSSGSGSREHHALPQGFLAAQLHPLGDPIVNLTSNDAIDGSPTAVELARELNGYTLAPIQDLTGATIAVGKRVDGFAQLKDDGSTACGCWIYSGCYTAKGNMMARRDNTDPGNRGIAPN